MDWDTIRRLEFPAALNKVQLRAAGGSPMSRSASNAALSYYAQMLNLGDLFWENYRTEVEKIRGEVARLIGGRTGEIAFLLNTSSCMAVAASLLRHGTVVHPAHEFPASIHAIRRRGFEVRTVQPKNNRFLIADIEKELSGDISAFVESHIQFLTGYRQDIEETGNLCASKGITHIVNATQSLGAFHIDVTKQKIDVLVSSGLKWLCAGYGIGILYARTELLEKRGLPRFTGWLSVTDPLRMDNRNTRVTKLARSMDSFGGSPNFPGIFALGGSLSLIRRIGDGDLGSGIAKISSRICELSGYVFDILRGLGLDIVTPIEKDHRSGIVSADLPNAKEVARKLEDKGILVSCRYNPETGKQSFLRIAAHFYNNFDDLDALGKGLSEILCR